MAELFAAESPLSFAVSSVVDGGGSPSNSRMLSNFLALSGEKKGRISITMNVDVNANVAHINSTSFSVSVRLIPIKTQRPGPIELITLSATRLGI